jgi:hypothetical protein
MKRMHRIAATTPVRTPWILVAAAALLLQGCSGPTLSPWHTERLDEEFTARKADEIRSFEDYLQLEERLFAQLEEKVYAQTGTGPEYALVRFSKGSIADPAVRTPNWNRSFELLPAAAPVGGVLLLHGMSDSPYSLRALGEALHARGYHVVGLRLPGHGTSPAGLRTVSVPDMAAAVRLAMDHLATRLGNEAGAYHRVLKRRDAGAGLHADGAGGGRGTGARKPGAGFSGDRHQSRGCVRGVEATPVIHPRTGRSRLAGRRTGVRSLQVQLLRHQRR